MPRITPIHWKVLECIFLKAGFTFERQEGSHRSYSKSNCLRPVIIPTYKEIDTDIIHANMRTANMSRDEYFTYWAECR